MINNNVIVQYNGEFLLDILLTVDPSPYNGCGMVRWHFIVYCYYLLNYVLRCILFCCVWWPGMAINVSVQYNGGFLLENILLTQGYYNRGRNPFKCHEEVSYL